MLSFVKQILRGLLPQKAPQWTSPLSQERLSEWIFYQFVCWLVTIDFFFKTPLPTCWWLSIYVASWLAWTLYGPIPFLGSAPNPLLYLLLTFWASMFAYQKYLMRRLQKS